ncbi:sigma-70 family RNA polymerase sigma factor [Pseudomonas proteolytica]|uniref:RNA polymerase sigma factor n=1 Tax=Pseudomonas proteolytica TaxID=219574 RepID=A0AAW5ABL8_9PSED|nr:sigma-70 family RNA polymerase sigma factor [Pseudomonas proteolytica]KAA8696170.1 sigma-70 family RNA polymerase sigma factor [Pseudomonas proteolytica]MCF5061133.1 sigma-70 family RNA polymerase sigma factor [Pseudomonas proteolytica]MCF5104734.1 sigma-70 family RNA polymerase sigma factor [Pseudomonas proteolytica]TWR71642.1 sigma-70 family RNA polymerase sigma factor [Pseudomonas proteolytica]SED71780.1 RNA polymerase sigma-70 factor, ECF subfamily [Pseudomonas proteolytica]
MASSSSTHRAVGELYAQHHGWVVQLLRRKLGGQEQALDLAQDTFVRILSSGPLPSLREPRAYLNTVASRLCGQYFRRQALERAYEQSLAILEPEHAPSPETRLLVLEALDAVGQVLDGLGSRVREIFLLSQLDGLTYPQIAEQLGLTVNVVQKAMLKAYRHCYLAVYQA